MVGIIETSGSSRTFILPNILAKWPWTRTLSEHYSEAKSESSAWIESFKPFNTRGLKRFRQCDFSLLSSLAYSPREKPVIRLGCDLMHIFFVYDEYTDIEDRAGAHRAHEIAADAFLNPDKPRPQGEVCIGSIVQDFLKNATAFVGPNAPCIEHFIHAWITYTDAVVQEADDRVNVKYRNFDDYLQIRRNTAGGYPTLALVEFGLDLPENVYQHPKLASLRRKGSDLIGIINDVYSFAMEHSRGLSVHNSVEAVMHEQGITLQESMDWLGRYGQNLVDSFLADIATLPSWGPEIDEKVRIYVDGLGQWIRGMDDWSFESRRYFGLRGSEVKKTRVMTLLPPSRGYVKVPKSTVAPMTAEGVQNVLQEYGAVGITA